MGQHVLIEQDNGQDEQKEGMWLPSAYIKKIITNTMYGLILIIS